MALFQKKPDISSSMPLYSLGLHKSVMIVGLGNVGKQYDETRHNIGFGTVDVLANSQGFGSWTNKKDLKCMLTMLTIGDTRVLLCKPTTMMNLSGEAMQALSHFYNIDLPSIVVVHDDLDVNFGQIRTRVGGSSAGNNGIKSISKIMGEGYGRVRIGIGPKKPEQIDSADFVLAKFTKSESAQIKNLLQESTAILTEYIHSTVLPNETRSFLV